MLDTPGLLEELATVESMKLPEAACRKTLGVKPPPYPVAGALRGVLHCTGPLEKPVFSGQHTFTIWEQHVVWQDLVLASDLPTCNLQQAASLAYLPEMHHHSLCGVSAP